MSETKKTQETPVQPQKLPVRKSQPKEKNAPTVEPLAVDQSIYDKFTSLKFLELSGAKLTEPAQKELAALEAEVKACKGRKPIRTVRAAINQEILLLVEGIPITAAMEQIIKAKGVEKYYFG